MDNSKKLTGIIMKGVGGLYTVRPYLNGVPGDPVPCRARGRFRLDGVTPLTGDDVLIERDTDAEKSGEAQYVITDLLERRNSLVRPPLSNLSHVFLLIPAARPKPDLITADKLTAILESEEIEPVIVACKLDADRAEAERIRGVYRTAGFSSFAVSSVTGEGCDELMEYISDIASGGMAAGVPVRAAVAGVSGAGKSTLMKRLFPELDLRAGAVSRKTERGRHTTRTTELYPLTAGGAPFLFADTPGFSMLDFTRFTFFQPEDLPLYFREFADCLGKCRYTKCTHQREEGCAVLEKMAAGGIPVSRHDGDVRIFGELKQKPLWKREKEAAARLPGKSR